MKLLKRTVVKQLAVFCLVVGLTFGWLSVARAADATVGNVAELMAALTADGAAHTITLSADITATDQTIAINGKHITFALNGNTLKIVQTDGPALQVANGSVLISGSGELNVTGSTYGLSVSGNGTATVTTATATAGTGVRSYGTATVTGDVIGTVGGVAALNAATLVTINGNVTASTGDGAMATGGGEIVIEGAVAGFSHGAYASDNSSSITVEGSTTGTGAGSYGAAANLGASIVVQDVKGDTFGVYSSGAGSHVEVKLDTEATGVGGDGAYASSGGSVLVRGNALGYVGVAASNGGVAQILGNAGTATSHIGAWTYDGNAKVTVDGTVSGAEAIRLESTAKVQDDAGRTKPTTKLGYDTYSDANGNSVWVKTADFSVSNSPVSLSSAGGASLMTITGHDLPSGIIVTAYD